MRTYISYGAHCDRSIVTARYCAVQHGKGHRIIDFVHERRRVDQFDAARTVNVLEVERDLIKIDH